MRLIKRLYLFILQTFLPLFAMTFFIVLFIVLMQFLWKNIDDLVGKGLPFSVLAELFFYAALTLVPLALPLAVLLASLMTFGNLGERSELTAIKAAGISLVRTMKPLIITVALIAVGGFFFQNNVLPVAQVKMWTLLFSVRQKSPEVEIPEGSFYDQIPGYNLYVKSKNKDTGVLYDVMIYDLSRGGDNSTILLADSARLAFTPDNRYLYLHLFTGEQFENLRDQRALDRNVPFRRESFLEKEVLISFDANFNRLDEEGMRRQYVGKNISELRASIDSIGAMRDSTGHVVARELRERAFPQLIGAAYFSDPHTRPETLFGNSIEQARTDRHESETRTNIYDALPKPAGKSAPLSLDSLLADLTPQQQIDLISTARNLTRSKQGEFQFRASITGDEKRILRRHQMELIKKFTLSVACLIFFFIGAPLGAIIRKGGIGTPLVISVLLFLVYYIIDNTGMKMARDGSVPVWVGMWLSSFLLGPLGIYVTYKAMNDSSVFDKESYMRIIRYLFGLPIKRFVPLKKVIINEIDPAYAETLIGRTAKLCHRALAETPHVQHYLTYWNKGYRPGLLGRFGSRLDSLVTYLSDSRDIRLLDKLQHLPVVRPLWIYCPVRNRRLRMAFKWFIPAGGIIWLLSLRYQRRLHRELTGSVTILNWLAQYFENAAQGSEE